MSNHRWTKLPDTNEGVFKIKHYVCNRCSCEKQVGNYKFAEPSYIRSGNIFDNAPVCVEMGRRSNEPLD